MRKRFAAPFVLVVGCSSGAAPDKPTHPTGVPVDAATRAASPADAAPADAARVAFDPCKLPPSPDNPTCNPPRPTKAIEARIINVATVGDTVELVLDQGSKQGVTMQWRAQLVGRTGKLVAPLEVMSVQTSTTRVRLQATQPPAPDHKASLTPP